MWGRRQKAVSSCALHAHSAIGERRLLALLMTKWDVEDLDAGGQLVDHLNRETLEAESDRDRRWNIVLAMLEALRD